MCMLVWTATTMLLSMHTLLSITKRRMGRVLTMFKVQLCMQWTTPVGQTLVSRVSKVSANGFLVYDSTDEEEPPEVIIEVNEAASDDREFTRRELLARCTAMYSLH